MVGGSVLQLSQVSQARAGEAATNQIQPSPVSQRSDDRQGADLHSKLGLTQSGSSQRSQFKGNVDLTQNIVKLARDRI